MTGAHSEDPTKSDRGTDPSTAVRRPWWRFIEEAVVLLLLAGILVASAAGVATRFANEPLEWTEPLSRYLLIWLTMLGAAVLVKNHAHIEIDFIYQRLPERGRTSLNILGQLVQSGIAIYLLVFGWELVATTHARTTVPGVTLQMVYACVPIAAILILFYSARDAYRATSRFGGRKK